MITRLLEFFALSQTNTLRCLSFCLPEWRGFIARQITSAGFDMTLNAVQGSVLLNGNQCSNVDLCTAVQKIQDITSVRNCTGLYLGVPTLIYYLLKHACCTPIVYYFKGNCLSSPLWNGCCAEQDQELNNWQSRIEHIDKIEFADNAPVDLELHATQYSLAFPLHL